MRNDSRNEPSGLPPSLQNKSAGQVLIYIIFGFIGADAVLLLTMFFIASGIQNHPVPLNPLPGYLLPTFYFAGLIFLLISMLWLRLRIANDPYLPRKDFQQRIFICIALANINQYLGAAWIFLGGMFSESIPFFAGPALVLLLFVLPLVSKQARR